MITLLNRYTNGNYKVSIFSNGTKIRVLDKRYYSKFEPVFPENIDMKISNKCSIGCKYCHEDSKSNGKVADFDKWKNFLRTLQPGTELALGGGALSEIEPEKFKEFLIFLFNRGIITNITVNQMEIENNDFYQFLCDNKECFYGIGVSFKHMSPRLEEFLKLFKDCAVVHTIVGLVTQTEIDYLKNLNCKILFLGYKDFRRGETYKNVFSDIIERNRLYLENNILELSKYFDTMSFDCLATEQLSLRDKVDTDIWKKTYMGDDGHFTMYVDLVEGMYALNSTDPVENRLPLDPNDISCNIFKKIREKNNIL